MFPSEVVCRGWQLVHARPTSQSKLSSKLAPALHTHQHRVIYKLCASDRVATHAYVLRGFPTRLYAPGFVTRFMTLGRWQSPTLSTNSQHYMELECSLPRSQQTSVHTLPALLLIWIKVPFAPDWRGSPQDATECPTPCPWFAFFQLLSILLL